jgi:hypothetical protein
MAPSLSLLGNGAQPVCEVPLIVPDSIKVKLVWDLLEIGTGKV